MFPVHENKTDSSAPASFYDDSLADIISPSTRASDMPTWPELFRGQRERPINVLVVDDDPHIRNVIVQDLLTDLRIQVVGQAANFREARKIIPQVAFDVLLVDLNLGDGSGFELITQALAIRPGIEVVVVSGIDDDRRVLQAFSMGATGFLIKNSWFGNFSRAVLEVVNGGAPITPQLARRLLGQLDFSHARSHTSDSTHEHSVLSTREKDVLRHISSGFTSAEVGERLHISVQTVNCHVKNIYRKLQVHSRTQAINYANQHGLI
ncbi:response regulator transcription factor [Xylophilus sp. GOD-11R]|uniref:response regulator transcription factor n=1 Tax=Xylophilus sp. GOD-11R TaxID=3089814 RepID=UPI00298C640D|nr:response regulator transcription factor [Xylophilus sp. GOD-11R]WPB55492.1 response regulator transcription factor [Xylophilus sp. GOD-11R]